MSRVGEFRLLCVHLMKEHPQLLYRNVRWLGGGLVFKAHRLVHHSGRGLSFKKERREADGEHCLPDQVPPPLSTLDLRENFIELMTLDRKLKASREGSK